jgi:hypothetical protein
MRLEGTGIRPIMAFDPIQRTLDPGREKGLEREKA